MCKFPNGIIIGTHNEDPDGARKEWSKAAVPRRLTLQSLLEVETPVRRQYGGAELASSLRVGTLESVGHHNL